MLQGRKATTKVCVMKSVTTVGNGSLIPLEISRYQSRIPASKLSCLRDEGLGCSYTDSHRSLVQSCFQHRVNSSSFRPATWAGGADTSGQR